jgi:hypothetical protein
MSYLIATLQYALSRKRPYKGKGEAALRVFVRRMVGGASTIDDAGNLIIDRRQRQDGGTSRTLFVAHMDTVHREDGRNTFVQDRAKRILKADGAPLGADDGAGVAMLVHLLKHGVPGLYVFTVGEEVGGVGAKYFARTQKDVLTNEIDRAIAFDRRGGTSVITHQSCGKCASPEFAEALSEKLSNANDALLYMPDDTGVYTDTAEFVDMVAECTNISVGYECEHGDKESLDMAHFEALADGVLKFDWDTLPVVRTPGDDGYARGAWGAWGKAGSWYGTTGNWNDVWDAEDDRANMCTREQRFALYDALDFAADGHCAQLRDLLQEYVDAEYEGASLDELYEARGIVNEGRCDAEMIDVMYEAADASPGDEVWSACAAGYELLIERDHKEKRAELAEQQRH